MPRCRVAALPRAAYYEILCKKVPETVFYLDIFLYLCT